MRHAYFGKKLSRTTDERKRLFRSLARDLILHGKIETSLAKAKAVQPLVESLITMLKQQTDVSKRHVLAALNDRDVVNSLVDESQTRFGKRTSGFTRIIRLGRRMGDGGDSVQLSFVDERIVAEQIKPATGKTGVKEEPRKKEVKEVKPAVKRSRVKKT
jgi:large subunit ribosomal protein L17